MRFIITTLILLQLINAQDCSIYFESKQRQIDQKIEELDEAKQALESYKAAFISLQKEKEEQNQTILKEIKKEQDKLNEVRDENIKLLAAIRQLRDEIIANKSDKVAQTYSKMKDASAASIMESMDNEDVLKIMINLEPKKIASILSKMNPKKASEVTKLLQDTKLDKIKK